MGTASRLTIEENMAIAQRRGKSRGLGWGVREKDRELFREAFEGTEYRFREPPQSRHPIFVWWATSSVDLGHGSLWSNPQTLASG